MNPMDGPAGRLPLTPEEQDWGRSRARLARHEIDGEDAVHLWDLFETFGVLAVKGEE